MFQRYHPKNVQEGRNDQNNGEEVFLIFNPVLGQWDVKEKFDE